jgi:hypothetical protein
LGFNYQGVCKVTLPCGAKGEVALGIQVIDGPAMATVERVIEKPEDLGDCVRYSDTSEDPWKSRIESACGLKLPETTKSAAFGVSDEILKVVEPLPRVRVQTFGGGKTGFQGQTHTKGRSKKEKRPTGRKIDKDTPMEARKSDKWVCPECEGGPPLYWSVTQEGRLWCSKCSKYFTAPDEPQCPCGASLPNEGDTHCSIQCFNKYDQRGETDDMIMCDDCGKASTGKFYCCDWCGADECDNCGKFHDKCPQYGDDATGVLWNGMVVV